MRRPYVRARASPSGIDRRMLRETRSAAPNAVVTRVLEWTLSFNETDDESRGLDRALRQAAGRHQRDDGVAGEAPRLARAQSAAPGPAPAAFLVEAALGAVAPVLVRELPRLERVVGGRGSA